jgi:hypothetical protein
MTGSVRMRREATVTAMMAGVESGDGETVDVCSGGIEDVCGRTPAGKMEDEVMNAVLLVAVVSA